MAEFEITISFEGFANYFYETRKKFVTDATLINLDTFFVNSIIVRAYQINKGFQAMVDSGNYLCAAPLVRLQLENLFVLFGGLIYRGDNYIKRFLEGGRLDQLKYNDRSITISYLAEMFDKYNWLPIKIKLTDYYKEFCKFIHPSQSTQEAFKAATSSEDRKVTLHNLEGKLYEDSEMEELSQKMLYVSFCYVPVLQDYLQCLENNIEEWNKVESRQATPEEAAKLNNEIEQLILNPTKRNNQPSD